MLLGACSNPIDASHDNQPAPPDTNRQTNSGEGVSPASDSLNKNDMTTGQKGVNTVTGQMYDKKGSSNTSMKMDSTGTKGDMKNTEDNKSAGKNDHKK